MSTYQELRGLKVKYLAANPDPGTAGDVWYDSATYELKGFVGRAAASSAAHMITARRTGASFGTQTANVAAGGWIPAFSAKTEEYNGTGWSAGEDLGTAASSQFGTGTLTAGLAYGGSTDPNGQEGVVTTLEYDGTDWTAGGDLTTARWSGTSGAGTQTAALCSSGYHDANVTNTEEYNGSAWTAGEAIDAGKRDFGQVGSQTASILFGGAPGLATSEEYDGTDYTAGPSMNTGRANIAASGTQTAALGMGGYKDPGYANNVELFDGTSWSELSGNLATARDGGFGSRGGTQLAALIAGGSTPSLTAATEEFNNTFEVVTQGAWTSGTAIPAAKVDFAGVGPQTAALAFGGLAGGSLSLTSQKYDGSAWTATNNMGTARRAMGALGTQTAAISFGGYISGPANVGLSEEFDGTSWAEGSNLNTDRARAGGFGIQTAGVAAGGDQGAPNNDAFAVTEEYNGTSWANGEDMGTARYTSAGAGILTAGLIAGGVGARPAQNKLAKVESYDGTDWTEVGDLTFARGNTCQGGGTSATDAVVFGGSPYSPVAGHTDFYDGTNWSTGPKLATIKSRHAGAAAASTTAWANGGAPSSSVPTATEEFTAGSTAETGSTIDFD